MPVHLDRSKLRLESFTEYQSLRSGSLTCEVILSVLTVFLCVLYFIAQVSSKPIILSYGNVVSIDDKKYDSLDFNQKTMTVVRMLQDSAEFQKFCGGDGCTETKRYENPYLHSQCDTQVTTNFAYVTDDYGGAELEKLGVSGGVSRPSNIQGIQESVRFEKQGALGSDKENSLYLFAGNGRTKKKINYAQQGAYAGLIYTEASSPVTLESCDGSLPIFTSDFWVMDAFKEPTSGSYGRIKNGGLEYDVISTTSNTLVKLNLRWATTEFDGLFGSLLESTKYLTVNQQVSSTINFNSSEFTSEAFDIKSLEARTVPDGVYNKIRQLYDESRLINVILFQIEPTIDERSNVISIFEVLAATGGIFNIIVASFMMILICVRTSPGGDEASSLANTKV